MNENLSSYPKENTHEHTMEFPVSQENDIFKMPDLDLSSFALTYEAPVFMAEQANIKLAKDLVSKITNPEKAEELFAPKIDTASLFGFIDRLDEAERLQQFHDFYGLAITEHLLRDVTDTETIHGFIECVLKNPLPKATVEKFSSLSPTEFNTAITDFLALNKVQDPITPNEIANDSVQNLLSPLTIVEHKSDAANESTKKQFKTKWADEEGSLARVGGIEVFEVKETDIDEADYKMPEYIKTNLPDNVTNTDILAFSLALKNNDSTTALECLNKAMGELKPDQVIIAESTIAALCDWRSNVLKNMTDKLSDMPDRAEAIKIRHKGFDRDRTIPPFAQVLTDKISGTLMSYAIDALRNNTASNKAAEEAIDKANNMFEEAVKTYQEVHTQGVPIFKEFSEYLAQQNQAQFHVGRDTMTTTFLASNALAWGHMSASERKNQIKHINISRSVTDPLDYALLDPNEKTRLRTSFKAYLDQQKINTTMTGVDGGYKGSNIASVLTSLNEDVSDQEIDKQAALVSADTSYKQRQFPGTQTDEYYRNFVQSMERWPKFMERSQGLKQIGTGDYAKYYLVSKRRTEPERLLAWVVQHAVWRGTLPDDVVSTAKK